MPSTTKPSTTKSATVPKGPTTPRLDCSEFNLMCEKCRPLYQRLIEYCSNHSLDPHAKTHPILFTNSFPADWKVDYGKVLDRVAEEFCWPLATTYNMLEPRFWAVAYMEQEGANEDDGDDNNGEQARSNENERLGTQDDGCDGDGGKSQKVKKKMTGWRKLLGANKGKYEARVTMKVLIEFHEKVEELKELTSHLFFGRMDPFEASNMRGATGWIAHPWDEVDEDGKPGHRTLTRLRFWHEVNQLSIHGRALNKKFLV